MPVASLIKKHKYIPLYIIGVLGLAVTLFAYFSISKSEHIKEQNRFTINAQNFVNSLEQELDFTVSVIDSLDGFYRSSTYVDREEFHSYSEVVLKNTQSIELLQWLPVISQEELPSYIAKAQEASQEDYQVKNITADGVLTISEPKKKYIPVYYSKPESLDHTFIGLDWNAIPERLQLLNKALMQGMSFAVLENLEGLPGNTITLLKPIYKNTRAKELHGFLAEFINIGKLVDEVKKQYPNFELCIRDAQTEDLVLYGSACRTDHVYIYKTQVSWGGENLEFVVVPNEAYSLRSIYLQAIITALILLILVLILLRYTKHSIDNSEIIEHEVELRTEALKRSNEELDRYAYIVSHDLKEPIRGIAAYLGILKKNNETNLDSESIAMIDTVVQLCQKMATMLKSIHEYSRLGNIDLAYKETNLDEVLKEILFSIDSYVKEHKVKIVVPRPLPTIECDSVRIGEVFRNLITNAIKYNQQENKTVEIGFKESLKAGTKFYVKDNGVGIDAKYHKSIFEMFKRLDNDDRGTGVGLSLVKKIIDRHGGSIEIESELEKGTTFWFTLAG